MYTVLLLQVSTLDLVDPKYGLNYLLLTSGKAATSGLQTHDSPPWHDSSLAPGRSASSSSPSSSSTNSSTNSSSRPSSSSSNSGVHPDGLNVWAAAAKQLQAQGWPLNVVQIYDNERTADSTQQWPPQQESVTSYYLPDTKQFWVAVDADHKWQHINHQAAHSAVLVRPDGHVAWRCVNHPPSNIQTASQALIEVLQTVLCSNAPAAAGSS